MRELGSGFETVGSDIAADPQFLMTLPRPTETALASSNPAGGATGVRLGISPQLVFKWAVDSASASRATIKLRDLTLGLGVKLQSVATSGDGLTIGGHDGAGGVDLRSWHRCSHSTRFSASPHSANGIR